MDSKDWITLIIPILFNGVLVAILNKILEKRVQRQNSKEFKRNLVIEKYGKLLIDLQEKYIFMLKVLDGAHREAEIKLHMNNFCDSLQRLYEFEEVYAVILSTQTPFIEKIFCDYEAILNEIRSRTKETDLEILNRTFNLYLHDIKANLDALLKDYFEM